MSDDYDDKRRLPRLLCSDNFSNTVIEAHDTVISATSLNFHRYGLAVFSASRLDCPTTCLASFEWRKKGGSIRIERIEGVVLYGFETEVGNQYGIQFYFDYLDSKVIDDLIEIENQLVFHNRQRARWKVD